ncbi:2,3-dihydro-2,3-dihydroxybenzoate dehydrogenase [Chromohalobacter canadensis]|uniref:2,3-dihydro-2,3-dihydroxybenzoate dehydrogenase n=1 Tax=Chromohalobacter canadensis TaxID=141389 RepID=UPI00240F39E5|nr:2,3-dihydro-2,3-dihydroxybenzoate dehydrogenase [Chromohalobacter canadensis]
MQLSGFENRVAFVTGAGGGIGAALVGLLQASGSVVVASDLAAPVLELSSEAPAVHAETLDVTDSGAVDALVERVERDIGPIDIGVNVAGVLQSGTIDTLDDDEWRRVFAVNADGVFHVSRALARAMTPRRRGAIVTVGSNAAGVPRHAMAAYAASKAAATMFTRCLGLELAPLGIRCNIVAPGSTLTPMQTGMWQDDNGAQRVIEGMPGVYKAGIPLGKLATPEDVANAVMFLLSDQAGHIAMGDLYVDGGATLRA